MVWWGGRGDGIIMLGVGLGGMLGAEGDARGLEEEGVYELWMYDDDLAWIWRLGWIGLIVMGLWLQYPSVWFNVTIVIRK